MAITPVLKEWAFRAGEGPQNAINKIPKKTQYCQRFFHMKSGVRGDGKKAGISGLRLSKNVMAPSDEGAVSFADRGREN